ncbi:hypothetical protein pclt_cds_510 [Pandoravirus celtis]|uniref:Uncharacterized protein n=1 Tax=Pandoravirus celtis TaxID=2568002 RepID=A0A4D6EHC7_9VIRU|nr:hypothetical protein pclt_cds_510 [Pandoravirus celtis]
MEKGGKKACIRRRIYASLGGDGVRGDGVEDAATVGAVHGDGVVSALGASGPPHCKRTRVPPPCPRNPFRAPSNPSVRPPLGSQRISLFISCSCFLFLVVRFFASWCQVAPFFPCIQTIAHCDKRPTARAARSATTLLPTILRTASMGRGGTIPSQPSIRIHRLNVSSPTHPTTGRVGGGNSPTTDQ